MGRKVLVSACLLGKKCRFDGRDAKNKVLIKFLRENRIKPLALCPEELGGLKGKRGPFEFRGKTKEVFEGKREVKDVWGRNYTKYFLKGAYRVLKIVKKEGINLAILKSKSPSCSPDYVYNGTFSRTLKKGLGICAYILKKNKVRVFSEFSYRKILAFLE